MNETGPQMEKCRLVFSGAGGQGVITAAVLLAEAAVCHAGLNAVQTQSYGAQARGGAARSDVIIWDRPIHFPRVLQPNVLVCLTQAAFNKYHPDIRPGGVLITDSGLVTVEKNIDARSVALPLSETVREKLGKTVVLNICMLGAVAAITHIIDPEAIRKVIETRFAEHLQEINCQALDLGLKLGQKSPTTA
ncbi:MAG: 2-oxoacid:acceptor oxidoreductase family protein [Thermodesulfobacteriota bacterium]